MTLPSFLIIGAMKSGTTTLFQDLATHPDVADPLDKEPGDLKSDEVLSPHGLAAYQRQFSACKAGQQTYEASTHYTQRPRWTGAAARARTILGKDLRILYIVREPVARACSHHRHLVAAGEADTDINTVVRDNPLLIQYSRYFMQLEPWLQTFDRDQIKVIRFESYVADRPSAATDVQAFLGLSPRPDLVHKSSISNASEGKLMHTSFSDNIGNSPLYRSLIRPLIPARFKRAAKQRLMRRTSGSVDAPRSDTIRLILDATAEDTQRISSLISPSLPAGHMAWDETSAMKLTRDA
ncbi:MAG: sulfotransferase [Phycisphaerales bacterium]|nr:sulfotransferase [Phycisphaerales bacterium]